MFGQCENKIDTLLKEKEELNFQKEKNNNRVNEINSKLETRMKKLENKAYRNRIQADDKNTRIDRRLDMVEQLIQLERKYANKMGGTGKGSRKNGKRR